MRVYELHRKETLDEDAWPLRSFHARIDIEMDFDGDVPSPAARRLALNALRETIERASPNDLAILSNPLHRTAATPDPDGTPNWSKPEDLDLRVIKSAHRIISEVAKRGVSGRSVLASELVGSIGLSAPTIGRLLRQGEVANQYLSRYVRVAPDGRTKSLDLTPEGRVLASKIRAGAVPS